MKAISEITKPHSKTKNGTRTALMWLRAVSTSSGDPVAACLGARSCVGWQEAALVGHAAAVKVRLISPPIKPSLWMEQLSSAISKCDGRT
ncbi:hypothetical protein PAMP_001882 [Pampus punctatissimus]